MPYEFVDVPFTESYWENLGCEWLMTNSKIVCTQCEAEYSAEYADKEEWEYCPKCGETFL